MKRAAAVLIISVVVGCAGGVGGRGARYPNPVTPEVQARFNEAENLYRSGRSVEADAAFAKVISEFPYNELTDESRFRRGEIAFSKGEYAKAIEFYKQAHAEIASPHVTPKAQFKAALAYHRLGANNEVLSELGEIHRSDTSAVLRLRMDSLGVRASRAAGRDPNEGIIWYLYLLDDYTDSGGQTTAIPLEELVLEEEALNEVRRWVDDRAVLRASVEALPLKEMKGRRSGGFAQYKLSYVLHCAGETAEAEHLLKSYISSYPKHEYYGAARLLMGELGGALGDGAGIAIGVVLPLSGRMKVYGESVLHGVECAVGVFEPCTGPAGMKVVIRDSQGPGGAVKAVEELVEEGVVAVIGPLTSSDAIPAATRAEQLAVPMISLSQRPGVAEVGDYIFRSSVSPSSEVSSLVDYAVGKKKLRRAFVLYPDNKKGEEYKQLFSKAMEAVGGKVVVSQSYSPNQMEFASELRGRGIAEHTVDFAGGGRSYDAVFIPDSFWAVGYIAPTLALMGVGKVRLLGIPRWNDPELIERGGEYVEGAIFVDSFYKKAPDSEVVSFVSRFNEAFGVEPTLLEALGFEAASVIIRAVRQEGAASRELVKVALSRVGGFRGVAGLTSFNPKGDAQRKLWVLTIKDGTIQPAE